MKNETSKAALIRASRILGIRMSRLGLCAPVSTSVSAGAWGFGGDSYNSVINAAERAAVRELGHGHSSPVALSSVYSAGDLLRSTQPTHPFVPMSSCPNTPMAALRSGCLGAVAASAIVAAMSTTSSTERISGTNALRKLIQSEQIRGDRDFFQATTEEEDDNEKSPVDILLFRLALTEALLHDRRDGNATVEVKNAVQSLDRNEECPPAYLLLGRCMLRQGARVEGLKSLETAEKWTVNEDMQHFPLWLKSMWEWSAKEASRLLTVHKASESARTSAVDAYARGSFTDAALLYGRSIKLLNIGLPDDKRGRATALSDKAGCHRRERKLDAAITELDMALALFPRYSRALFRRGACLLEKGDAEGAIDSFKSLYRVDRAWHNLSDWLVRAFTLQKRQKQGYKGGDRGNYDETQASANSTNDDHTASNNGGGVNQEAAKIASQVDHYAVLGVTVDATEKQLKNAYRMMSLKYHPDKPTGNTAAFQRIATAFETLSDPDKRLAFDEGGDIKVKRGGKDDDDSDEEDEEHKTTMKEEVEREFYPERYHFWPFGDPFIQKRKHMAQKAKAEAEKARQSSSRRDGSKSWQDEDHYW
jgi:tetratricopeptide (TPR) repeat protein